VGVRAAVAVWAVAVALSRVALGKHYALDTVLGAAIGASYGFALERHIGPGTRCYAYVASGVAITAQWGPCVVGAGVWGAAKGWRSRSAARAAVAASLVAFYTLYGSLFAATVGTGACDWERGAGLRDAPHWAEQ